MTRRDKWLDPPRACVARYRAWRDGARAVAAQHDIPPPEKIRALNWVAYYAPPKSWSKKRRQEVIGHLHRSRPDRDNIDKAVLDALFDEDSAIAAGCIVKRWSLTERLEIIIVTEV